MTPMWLGIQESHSCPHHPASCGVEKTWARTAQAQLCLGPQGPNVLGTLTLLGPKDREGWVGEGGREGKTLELS